jgi:protein-ribulosamine 3-kinase
LVDWQRVATCFANDHGISFNPDRVTAVSGGSIAASYRCDGAQGSYFVKLAPADSAALFAAEAEGAEALANTDALRVPNVYAMGINDTSSYLVLEWVDFGHANSEVHARLGTQLAQLHRTGAERHGWRRANFIGATPQMNEPMTDWAQFYRRCRLLPQLALARARGFETVATRGELVSRRLDELLGHVPEPALLHGDLWGGNWAVDELGQPVVFDPAVYFGDRETDLAMTRLFGGFDAEFYAAYERAWPLPVGWPDRLPAYQLYHVLNHLNLFGGGYLGQANSLLEQLERTI